MKSRWKLPALVPATLFFAALARGQEFDTPFAPGDTFSISHTPMSAKLVPLDCDAKKIPIHGYRHAGNEAIFLIPENSPTCTYEVMGTKIRVVRPETKRVAEAKSAKSAHPDQPTAAAQK